MEIIGLDLHKRESQLSINADDGTIPDRRIVTQSRPVHRRVGWAAATAGPAAETHDVSEM